MALTKIGKEGITGVSNASNATFLTATSAEGVTLAGTLAVTGVHTVGSNAVATSDGGAATTSIVQGLCKAFIFTNQITAADSFNMTATTDHGTGTYTNSITNNMGSANWNLMHNAGLEGETYGLILESSGTAKTSGAVKFITNSNGNSAQDASKIQQCCFGDLA